MIANRIESGSGTTVVTGGNPIAAQQNVLAKERRFMASWENTPFAIGNNPFEQFRPSDNTDPTFYNVPNMAWVQVIMGYAQAHFRAAIGFVSVPVPNALFT